LLNRNWLIRFSSTTADWVRRRRSPFLSITPSPPASRPTYCSPRIPEVRIFAVVSREELEFRVEVHGDHRLVGLAIEADAGDAADNHAGALHRTALLSTADVGELAFT
jgi:hypothetical protein